MASSRWSSRAKAVWASFSLNCTVVDIKPITAGAATTLWLSENTGISTTGELKTHPAAAVIGLQFTNGCFYYVCAPRLTSLSFKEINRWLTSVICAISDKYSLLSLFFPPANFSVTVLKQRKAGSTIWWQCHNVVTTGWEGSSLSCVWISALLDWKGATELWHTIESRAKDLAQLQQPVSSQLVCCLFTYSFFSCSFLKVHKWKGSFPI